MVVIPKIINIPPHDERWYNCEKLKKLIAAEIIIN